jgi:mono/diheme cytochrome c family protein
MTGIIRHVTAGLLLALAGTAAAQAQEGDPERGHDFAKKICAECHGVEKGYQPSTEPFAPTFEAVAKAPGMSPLALSVFLQTPHSTMPNLVLTATERADIIAYITSLKN